MFSRPRMPICLLLCACLLPAFARTGQEAAKKTVTITGCLQKGNALDRFTLTGHNGKAYGLRSASVKLSDHVGHSVTIKGTLKRDPKRDDYDFEGSEAKEGYGKDQVLDQVDVDVTSLKMNSTSCPAASGK